MTRVVAYILLHVCNGRYLAIDKKLVIQGKSKKSTQQIKHCVSPEKEKTRLHIVKQNVFLHTKKKHDIHVMSTHQ